MAFDWIRLFDAKGVPYVLKGPNTGRGHASVRCPFCGAADPSQHMSVNLHGPGWRCFRNDAHKGKSRSYLIQALLRCSLAEARDLAEEDAEIVPTDDDLLTVIRKNLGAVAGSRSTRLELMREFRPMEPGGGGRQRYFDEYLEDRGFGPKQRAWLYSTYNLHYALRGPFGYRVILPIYDAVSRLVSWTGRSIIPGELPRYRTLSLEANEERGIPAGLAAPGSVLYGLPILRAKTRQRALVICEGPLDALKISAFGHSHGVWGTCLFGLNVTDEQVSQLIGLADNFARLWLCLDPDQGVLAYRTLERLTPVRMRMADRFLPEGVKDPGDLSRADPKRRDVMSFINSVAT